MNAIEEAKKATKNRKVVVIGDEVHQKLKKISQETGIKLEKLTENAIIKGLEAL